MTTQMTAPEFVRKCKENGIEILTSSEGVVTLTKSFAPGNNDAAMEAESAVSVIYSLPSGAPGSTWGTTSDGVGYLSALRTGLMRINRSGIRRRYTREIAKLSNLEY